MTPPADDQNAIGVRLQPHDAQLLTGLTQHLRGSQSQVVSMALRHLAETINRDGAIYVDTQGISPRPPTARLLSQVSYYVTEVDGDLLLAVRDPGRELPAIGSTLITLAREDPMAWRVMGHRIHIEADGVSSSRSAIGTRYVEVERVTAVADPEEPGGVRAAKLWDDDRYIPSPGVGGGGRSAPLVPGIRAKPPG